MSHQTRIINIEGMTCEGCVKSVHDAVSKIAGVESIEVSLEDKRATATFEDSKTTAQSIASAIEEAGFDATVANA